MMANLARRGIKPVRTAILFVGAVWTVFRDVSTEEMLLIFSMLVRGIDGEDVIDASAGRGFFLFRRSLWARMTRVWTAVS